MSSAPYPRRPGAAGRWLLAGLVAATAACSGGPRPPAAPPPRTESPPEPSEIAAPPPPEPSPEPAVAEPRAPAPKVIIEPAEPEPGEPLTLAEAAQRERQRRRRAGEPIAVINDANLEEHAVGQLTFMEDDAADTAAPDGPAAAADDPEEGPDEQYWRQRVLTIRQRLADAAMEVPALEGEAAELRRRFYETDDAYYRDSRIKPAWDRAIDQTAQARAAVDALRDELAAALEEGRQAGALPGWLREGIDLVPPEPEPEPDTYEPGEPVIVGEDPEGGGS